MNIGEQLEASLKSILKTIQDGEKKINLMEKFIGKLTEAVTDSGLECVEDDIKALCYVSACIAKEFEVTDIELVQVMLSAIQTVKDSDEDVE